MDIKPARFYLFESMYFVWGVLLSKLVDATVVPVVYLIIMVLTLL